MLGTKFTAFGNQHRPQNLALLLPKQIAPKGVNPFATIVSLYFSCGVITRLFSCLVIYGSEMLYREMLQKLSHSQGRWRSIQLCGFVGLKGTNFAGELLVVGRAVNSWGQGWTADELLEEATLNRVATEMFNNDALLTWVSDQWGSKVEYNTRRSAFWRVIREVVQELSLANVENASWPSHIAWSNLYKISPFVGRNPSEVLADTQFPNCAGILKAEIKALTPRRILFLTGLNWAQRFLKELDFRPASSVDYPVEASGHIFSGSQVVVLPHPERKPGRPIVTAAVSCLSKT